MTTTTEACVRGCSLRNQHLSECEGATDETCHGCLPRRAEYGHLCWPCHRRLELMLTDAETIDRWLSGNMTSGEGAARVHQDYERGGGDQNPSPLKVDVYVQRQALRDHWASWVDWLTERESLHGPDQHSVDKDAGYLLQWQDRIEGWDTIGDMWEYTAEMISLAHALAPWRPEMKRLGGGVACPECGESNLAIFGGESDVTCLSCRTMILEKHFGVWEQIVDAAS